MVREREEERQKLIKRMNTLASEGRRLESEISKTLFAGLPGLSDAVVAVIRNHVEQALAFESTGRRVEEQVKFGNSTAAVELLRHFESDEVKVSDQVKAQFDEALNKLKVAAKAPKKKASKALTS
jgi:tripartite-type tricarboxylate transporter receptor subunit TctC